MVLIRRIVSAILPAVMVVSLALPVAAETEEPSAGTMDEGPVEATGAGTEASAALRTEVEPAALAPVTLVYTGLESTGTDPVIVRAVSDFVQSRVSELGVYEVIGPSQVETLLGLEAQRQLLGCEGDAACITDIAGALASERILSGRLSMVGKRSILTLFLMDAAKVRILGNADRTVHEDDGIEALLDMIPGLVRQVVERDPEVTLAPEEPPPAPVFAPPPEAPVAEQVPAEEPVTETVRAPKTREEMLRDPRNGLLIGVRGEWLKNYGPLSAFYMHGQGGMVGMGLGAVAISPLHHLAGYGARGELRIMPFSWRRFAPYISASGVIVHLPQENILHWAPFLTAGVQAAWGRFVAGGDLSWAPREYPLTSTPGAAGLDSLLAGPSVGLSLSIRL